MSDVRRLGDRYQVGELLGRGGMAEVHEGRDLRLGRRVAIKILKPELATDPQFLARFRREAQSAASLNHPNIVAVYDTGEERLDEGPRPTVVPFIVMELVEGITLKELLRSGNRLVPERALEITSGILSALDYSHRHGIIHRDIKPGNVMLTAAGTVKVMDFGIARATADAGQTGTSTATVMGTAAYLSPEQAQGRPVDARSDLYSTGVVLFELLTRQPPFVGDAPVAVAFAHVTEPPPAPSSVDPSVPPALDPLVLKALAKDPADRYQSAVEFRAEVERAIAGVPVTQVLPAAAVGGLDPNATAVLRPDPGATIALTGAAGLAAAATGAMPPVVPGGAGDHYVPPPPTPSPRQGGRKKGGFWRGLGLFALMLVLVGALLWAAKVLFVSVSPTMVAVPDLDGLTVSQATTALSRVGLGLGREDLQTSERPEGTVIEQSPQPTELIEEGAKVDVVVSAGKQQVQVPDVVGYSSIEDARKTLARFDLVLGKVKEKNSDQPEETVLSQSPQAYESVDVGSAVDIWVSNAKVKVPDVVGQPSDQARNTLFDRGFEVVYGVEVVTDKYPAGTVVAQSPEGGQLAKKGSLVTLQLAKAPEPSPSPSPTDSGVTGGGADGQGGGGAVGGDSPGMSASPAR